MFDEIGSALVKIKTCPEPCDDGKVPIGTLSGASGKICRAACPIISPGCAYGIKLLYERNMRLTRAMTQIGVPRRHIENFSKSRKSLAVLGAMNWTGRGFLILYGGPGTGKSFGAAWAVREYIKNRISNPMDKKTWDEIDRAKDNVTWLNAQDTAADRIDRNLPQRACAASLLVMDDLGREEDTKSGNAAVSAVISKRYDAKQATVVTTELSLADIEKRYGRYLSDRLTEDVEDGGGVVDCGDDSMRLDTGLF
jgi:DNA replication protein DnaC